MRRFLAALAAVAVITSAAAQPPAQLQRPVEDTDEPRPAKPLRGSTVLVPPLIEENYAGPARPLRVVRLPIHAGKVSKMVATGLVANSRSWIARGDKYYSLCVPNRGKVACAPIVATPTMKDIDVSAYVDPNGVAKVTFQVNPATTREAKPLIAAISYFRARVSQQAENFERKTSTYAAPKSSAPDAYGTGTPGGQRGSMTIDLDMDSCNYDDWGAYDCTGGDGGSGGGGYDADSHDWGNDYSGDENNWYKPDSPDLPSYPGGNDNGDRDPCLDSGGNNVCQQVIITGERPDHMQETSLPSCVATPWSYHCVKRTPPVVGGIPIDEVPKGAAPWLPQSACDFSAFFCSEGQIPSAKPPPLTEEGRRAKAIRECVAAADAQFKYCFVAKAIMGAAFDFETCRRNALDQAKECDIQGMEQ